MSVDHIISGICNSRIKEVILIDDNTTLLDYKHQFIGSLHKLDNIAFRFYEQLRAMDNMNNFES